jgi:crotonobetainyl-CoA:carnitine CoA-transferase CaiB-like acyl-CoA transferase
MDADDGVLAVGCYNDSNHRSGAQLMSAPSRRPEIRRRRTRKEKILKLRKSLAKASSETDRARFRAKLHRQGLVSPGTPLLKD